MKLYMVLKTTDTFQNSEADHDFKECEDEEERPKRRQKISQNHEKYNNTQMVEQTKKKNEARNQKFKVGDFVSIQIDRVDKTSPLHSNLLLGKIEEVVNSYACVETKFGRINTLISPTRYILAQLALRTLNLIILRSCHFL